MRLAPLNKTLGVKTRMTKKEILDFIYKLIKLLKPEFYNKITWAVVIAGLALLSTSLIDKIISAVFELSFQIKLTDGNDAVIGIALVIIGLGYHLLKKWGQRAIVSNISSHEYKKKFLSDSIY